VKLSQTRKIAVQYYAIIATDLLAIQACHMPVARPREVICPVCGLFVWTLNLDWACSTLCVELNLIISELFFFHKYTYYTQRNSRIMCWGLLCLSVSFVPQLVTFCRF